MAIVFDESLRTGNGLIDTQHQELIARVKQGDVSEANAVLNDLLGYVLFSQGNSLEAVKPRAIELCSLLSRTAIEGGAPTDSILKLNNQFLQNLLDIQLCFTDKLVQVFGIQTETTIHQFFSTFKHFFIFDFVFTFLRTFVFFNPPLF